MLARNNKTEYFLATDHPTSLDCLALGHLALALLPELHSPWLREAMLTKAPSVTAYVRRMRGQCFGDDPVVPDLASNPPPTTAGTILPWQAPERPSLPKIGSTILNTLADATPIWKDFRANARVKQMAESADSGLSEEDSKSLSSYAKQNKSDMFLSIAAVGAGAMALIGYMVHVGLFDTRAEEEEEEKGSVVVDLDPNSTADFLSGLTG